MAGIENDCNHANMDQSDPVEDCHMSRCEIKPGDCTEIQTPEICDDSAVLGSGDTKMAINNTPEVDTTVDVEVLKKNEHEATHDPLEVEAILICSSNDIQVDINSDVHVHTISDTRVGSPTSVSEAKNTDIVNNGNLQAVDGIDLVGGADYTVTTGVTGLDSGTEGSVYRDDLLCKFSVEHTEDSYNHSSDVFVASTAGICFTAGCRVFVTDVSGNTLLAAIDLEHRPTRVVWACNNTVLVIGDSERVLHFVDLQTQTFLFSHAVISDPSKSSGANPPDILRIICTSLESADSDVVSDESLYVLFADGHVQRYTNLNLSALRTAILATCLDQAQEIRDRIIVDSFDGWQTHGDAGVCDMRVASLRSGTLVPATASRQQQVFLVGKGLSKWAVRDGQMGMLDYAVSREEDDMVMVQIELTPRNKYIVARHKANFMSLWDADTLVTLYRWDVPGVRMFSLLTSTSDHIRDIRVVLVVSNPTEDNNIAHPSTNRVESGSGNAQSLQIVSLPSNKKMFAVDMGTGGEPNVAVSNEPQNTIVYMVPSEIAVHTSSTDSHSNISPVERTIPSTRDPETTPNPNSTPTLEQKNIPAHTNTLSQNYVRRLTQSQPASLLYHLLSKHDFAVAVTYATRHSLDLGLVYSTQAAFLLNRVNDGGEDEAQESAFVQLIECLSQMKDLQAVIDICLTSELKSFTITRRLIDYGVARMDAETSQGTSVSKYLSTMHKRLHSRVLRMRHRFETYAMTIAEEDTQCRVWHETFRCESLADQICVALKMGRPAIAFLTWKRHLVTDHLFEHLETILHAIPDTLNSAILTRWLREDVLPRVAQVEPRAVVAQWAATYSRRLYALENVNWPDNAFILTDVIMESASNLLTAAKSYTVGLVAAGAVDRMSRFVPLSSGTENCTTDSAWSDLRSVHLTLALMVKICKDFDLSTSFEEFKSTTPLAQLFSLLDRIHSVDVLSSFIATKARAFADLRDLDLDTALHEYIVHTITLSERNAPVNFQPGAFPESRVLALYAHLKGRHAREECLKEIFRVASVPCSDRLQTEIDHAVGQGYAITTSYKEYCLRSLAFSYGITSFNVANEKLAKALLKFVCSRRTRPSALQDALTISRAYSGLDERDAYVNRIHFLAEEGLYDECCAVLMEMDEQMFPRIAGPVLTRLLTCVEEIENDIVKVLAYKDQRFADVLEATPQTPHTAMHTDHSHYTDRASTESAETNEANETNEEHKRLLAERLSLLRLCMRVLEVYEEVCEGQDEGELSSAWGSMQASAGRPSCLSTLHHLAQLQQEFDMVVPFSEFNKPSHRHRIYLNTVVQSYPQSETSSSGISSSHTHTTETVLETPTSRLLRLSALLFIKRSEALGAALCQWTLHAHNMSVEAYLETFTAIRSIITSEDMSLRPGSQASTVLKTDGERSRHKLSRGMIQSSLALLQLADPPMQLPTSQVDNTTATEMSGTHTLAVSMLRWVAAQGSASTVCDALESFKSGDLGHTIRTGQVAMYHSSATHINSHHKTNRGTSKLDECLSIPLCNRKSFLQGLQPPAITIDPLTIALRSKTTVHVPGDMIPNDRTSQLCRQFVDISLNRTLAGTLRPREHLRVAGSNTAVHMRAQSHSPVRSGNRTTPVLRSPTRASSCEMSLETQQPNQAEGGLTGHPVGSSDAGRNSYDRLCKTGLDLSDRLGERSDESDMLSDRSVRTGNRAEVDADYSVRPRVSVKAEPQCKTNRHPEDLLDNMDTGEMDIRRTTGLNVTYDEPRVGSAAQCVRQTGIGMRQSEGSIRHLMDDIRQPEGTAKVPVIAMTEPTEVTGAIVNCNRGYKRAISGAPITPGVGSDDGDVCMGIKEESTVKSISSTHRKRRRVTFAKSVVFKSQREYTEPGDETDHISRAEQYKDTAKALSERLQTSGRHLLALRLALHLSSVSEEYFVSGTLFTTGTTHATSHHSHRSPPARTSGSFRPARGSHTAHRSTFTPDVFVVECVRMSTGEVVGMVLRERVLDLGMCVAYGLAHTDAFNTNFRTLIKDVRIQQLFNRMQGLATVALSVAQCQQHQSHVDEYHNMVVTCKWYARCLQAGIRLNAKRLDEANGSYKECVMAELLVGSRLDVPLVREYCEWVRVPALSLVRLYVKIAIVDRRLGPDDDSKKSHSTHTTSREVLQNARFAKALDKLIQPMHQTHEGVSTLLFEDVMTVCSPYDYEAIRFTIDLITRLQTTWTPGKLPINKDNERSHKRLSKMLRQGGVLLKLLYKYHRATDARLSPSECDAFEQQDKLVQNLHTQGPVGKQLISGYLHRMRDQHARQRLPFHQLMRKKEVMSVLRNDVCSPAAECPGATSSDNLSDTLSPARGITMRMHAMVPLIKMLDIDHKEFVVAVMDGIIDGYSAAIQRLAHSTDSTQNDSQQTANECELQTGFLSVEKQRIARIYGMTYDTMSALVMSLPDVETRVFVLQQAAERFPIGRDRERMLFEAIKAAEKWLDGTPSRRIAYHNGVSAGEGLYEATMRALKQELVEQLRHQQTLSQLVDCHMCHPGLHTLTANALDLRSLICSLYCRHSVTMLELESAQLHVTVNEIAVRYDFNATSVRSGLIRLWIKHPDAVPKYDHIQYGGPEPTSAVDGLLTNGQALTISEAASISHTGKVTETLATSLEARISLAVARVLYLCQEELESATNADLLSELVFATPDEDVNDTSRYIAWRVLLGLVPLQELKMRLDMTCNEVHEFTAKLLVLSRLADLDVQHSERDLSDRASVIRLVRGLLCKPADSLEKQPGTACDGQEIQLAADICIIFDLTQSDTWEPVLEQLLQLRKFEYLRCLLATEYTLMWPTRVRRLQARPNDVPSSVPNFVDITRLWQSAVVDPLCAVDCTAPAATGLVSLLVQHNPIYDLNIPHILTCLLQHSESAAPADVTVFTSLCAQLVVWGAASQWKTQLVELIKASNHCCQIVAHLEEGVEVNVSQAQVQKELLAYVADNELFTKAQETGILGVLAEHVVHIGNIRGLLIYLLESQSVEDALELVEAHHALQQQLPNSQNCDISLDEKSHEPDCAEEKTDPLAMPGKQVRLQLLESYCRTMHIDLSFGD